MQSYASMKTLLAVGLFSLGLHAVAAGSLNLTLEAYRFEGAPGLLSEKSTLAKLDLLDDEAPVVVQTLVLPPGKTVHGSTSLGHYTLQSKVLVEPVKEATALLHVDCSLHEKIMVGSTATSTAHTTNTKLSLKPGQRTILSATFSSTDRSTTTYRVLVAQITE